MKFTPASAGFVDVLETSKPQFRHQALTDAARVDHDEIRPMVFIELQNCQSYFRSIKLKTVAGREILMLINMPPQRDGGKVAAAFRGGNVYAHDDFREFWDLIAHRKPFNIE